MHWRKKEQGLLAMALAVILAVGLLTGCESQKKKEEALQGTWVTIVQAEESEIKTLLEGKDFYEEEIALAEGIPMYYVKWVNFQSPSYSFGLDENGTKGYLRSFFQEVMDGMYEGRASLESAYGMDFTEMSKDEFRQFYVDIYGEADYGALIDALADAFYFDQPTETGSYTMAADKLRCTITGESKAEDLAFQINGDTLTLIYADGVEAYTRK